MKHVKLFEDYSDEELGDLIGDLRGIGHHDLKFHIDCAPGYKKEREKEEEFARNYKDGIGLISIEGTLGGVFLVNLRIVLTNRGKIELKVPMFDGNGEAELHITGNGFDVNKNYANQFFKDGPHEKTYTESLLKFYKELKK